MAAHSRKSPRGLQSSDPSNTAKSREESKGGTAKINSEEERREYNDPVSRKTLRRQFERKKRDERRNQSDLAGSEVTRKSYAAGHKIDSEK